MKINNIIVVIRSFVAFLAIAAISITASAQTDAQLAHYFEVPSYYNPAAIGSIDKLRIRGGARMQWVGIDNAPRTFLLTADMPFKLFNKRFGVGIVAQQETAGLFKNLSVGVQLGYKFKLLKGEFTAGLQLGFANEVFKGSDIYIPDEDDYHENDDEALPRYDVSGNTFDIGVGVFYTHKWFWAGVSCSHVMSPTISFTDNDKMGGSSTGSSTGDSTEKSYEIDLPRTLYFMAGSNIPIKNTLFEVMPSVFVKSDFTYTRAEFTGRVRYKKFLTGGVGYRYDDALIALIGAEIKGFYIGYSYEYPTSAIAKASKGSHEIIAGYSLKLDFSEKNKNKHKSIRIM